MSGCLFNLYLVLFVLQEIANTVVFLVTVDDDFIEHFLFLLARLFHCGKNRK